MFLIWASAHASAAASAVPTPPPISPASPSSTQMFPGQQGWEILLHRGNIRVEVRTTGAPTPEDVEKLIALFTGACEKNQRHKRRRSYNKLSIADADAEVRDKIKECAARQQAERHHEAQINSYEQMRGNNRKCQHPYRDLIEEHYNKSVKISFRVFSFETLRPIEQKMLQGQYQEAFNLIEDFLKGGPHTLNLLIKKAFCLLKQNRNSREIQEVSWLIIDVASKKDTLGWALGWAYYFLAQTEDCGLCKRGLLEHAGFIDDPLLNLYIYMSYYENNPQAQTYDLFLLAKRRLHPHQYLHPLVVPIPFLIKQHKDFMSHEETGQRKGARTYQKKDSGRRRGANLAYDCDY